MENLQENFFSIRRKYAKHHISFNDNATQSNHKKNQCHIAPSKSFLNEIIQKMGYSFLPLATVTHISARTIYNIHSGYVHNPHENIFRKLLGTTVIYSASSTTGREVNLCIN